METHGLPFPQIVGLVFTSFVTHELDFFLSVGGRYYSMSLELCSVSPLYVSLFSHTMYVGSIPIFSWWDHVWYPTHFVGEKNTPISSHLRPPRWRQGTSKCFMSINFCSRMELLKLISLRSSASWCGKTQPGAQKFWGFRRPRGNIHVHNIVCILYTCI